MKISIPKIVREMPLKEYAPEMGELALQVWVNPTREFVQRFTVLSSTTSGSELFAGGLAGGQTMDTEKATVEWYAELLSQGTPERAMSAEDLRSLWEQDPFLWTWITARCWQMIDEHRTALEKKPGRP